LATEISESSEGEDEERFPTGFPFCFN